MPENAALNGSTTDGDSEGTPTRERLVAEIKREMKKLDRNLTENEFGYLAPRNIDVYLDEFGDYETILKVSGREADTPSKQELVQEVQRLKDELGRVPNSTDMDNHGKYRYAQCREKFGSWGDTLEAAGFDRLESRAEHPDRDQLIDELHRLDDEFESRPTVKIVSEHSRYAPSEFRREFGTFTDALGEAGIDGKRPATKDELIDEAQRVDELVEGRLRTEDIDAHAEFSSSTYIRRFDSFRDVLLEIGYSESELPSEFTKDDVIDEVARLMDKYRENVSVTNFKDEAEMSSGVLYNHFDSWSDAKQTARDADTRWNV